MRSSPASTPDRIRSLALANSVDRRLFVYRARTTVDLPGRLQSHSLRCLRPWRVCAALLARRSGLRSDDRPAAEARIGSSRLAGRPGRPFDCYPDAAARRHVHSDTLRRLSCAAVTLSSPALLFVADRHLRSDARQSVGMGDMWRVAAIGRRHRGPVAVRSRSGVRYR